MQTCLWENHVVGRRCTCTGRNVQHFDGYPKNKNNSNTAGWKDVVYVSLQPLQVLLNLMSVHGQHVPPICSIVTAQPG